MKMDIIELPVAAEVMTQKFKSLKKQEIRLRVIRISFLEKYISQNIKSRR